MRRVLCMVVQLVWRWRYDMLWFVGGVALWRTTRDMPTLCHMPCGFFRFFYSVCALECGAKIIFFGHGHRLCIVMSLACGLCCCITMHWVTFSCVGGV